MDAIDVMSHPTDLDIQKQQLEVRTVFAKYIFLDVVQFTNNRSVEAQSFIVEKLNRIVHDALTQYGIGTSTDDRILLPTGDGMCISILGPALPYDIHMQVALTILELLHYHNEQFLDQTRTFQVRIGIDQNEDNIVIDVNGNDNLAGAGINVAARVMSKADGNQVLVGDAVFEMLRHREKYMNRFKSYDAKIKHDLTLRVHHYIGEGHEGLNINPPSELKPKEEPEPRFTRQVAYYFAFAIKHKKEVLSLMKEIYAIEESACILYWFLAEDATSKSAATEFERYYPYWDKIELPFKDQIEYLEKQDGQLIQDLARLLTRDKITKFSRYFEQYPTYPFVHIYVNQSGIEKLKKDAPKIWKEMGLDQYL